MSFVRKGGVVGGKSMGGAVRKVPPGCRPSVHNGQLLTSTGSDAFDKILGGGVPVGTLVLVEEDKHTAHSMDILKLFVGQGFHANSTVAVVTTEGPATSFAESCPALRQAGEMSKEDEAEEEKAAAAEDLKIAWRYQQFVEDKKAEEAKKMMRAPSLGMGGAGLRPAGSNSKGPAGLASPMDISKEIDKSVISANKPVLVDMSTNVSIACDEVFCKVEGAVKDSATATELSRKVVRVAVQSFATAAWKGDLVRFIHQLRGLARASVKPSPVSTETPAGGAVIMLTIPAYACEDTVMLRKIEHLCDLVVRIRSFAAMDTDTMQTEFSEYQGFFDVLKLPRFNTVVPVLPDTLSYGFKVRSRGLKIEKLHLAPEGEGASSGGGVRNVPKEKSCGTSVGNSLGGSSAMDF